MDNEPNVKDTPAPIEMGLPVEERPTVVQPRTLALVVIALFAVAIAAIIVAGAALGKVPAPAASAPVVTRQVTVAAKGTAIYYDVSGPTLNVGGSTIPGTLVVPVGTRIHVIGMVDAVGAKSSCSITVDGAVLSGEEGYGLDAASICDLVLK